MMDVKTLVSAATLKGYLLATDAPQAVVLLAEQIVEAATEGISAGRQIVESPRNEDVKLPEPSADLAEAIAETAKTAPSHDESRFAEPEAAPGEPEEEADTGLAEEVKKAPESVKVDRPGHNAKPPTSTLREVDMRTARGRNPDNVWEHWQIETLIRMKSEGAKPKAISLAVKKTPQQINNKWTWLPNTVKKAKPAVDADGWPLPVKRTLTQPAPDVKSSAEEPRMQFVKVRVKDSWGHEKEIERVAPLGAEQDPESGATVTKYPAGYAIGAYPQRNVSVKGGS